MSARKCVRWYGVLFISAACTQELPESTGTVVDSLGVRVVTFETRPTPTSRWQLDSVPLVSIGVSTGEKAYEFSRIIGVFPHSSGLLIGDGASGELRVFDSRGQHMRSVGRAGSGPGEFERLRWMATQGDSVYAWDLGINRITVFDPAFRVQRVEPLSFSQPGVYVVAGILRSGELVINPFGALNERIAAPRVLEGVTLLALARQPGSGRLDTIIRLPSRPAYVEPEGPLVNVPLTAAPAYAVADEAIWAGSGQKGELSRYRSDGSVDLVVRLYARRAVTPEHLSLYRTADLEHYSGSELAERERLLDRIPSPAQLPAFDIIRVDGEGRLWIRDYLLPGAERQEWLILDPFGTPVASITIPARLHIHALTRDRVIGVWRDDLGVEQVRVYGYVSVARG